MFYRLWKFESHVNRNDVIMKSLPKTMENNRKMRTSAEPNKIYRVGKVLMRAIQKYNFYWIWATVSKVMGIYVKFTKTTHQIWSCHVTLTSNFKNFYPSPNSVLNFRKSCQILGNWFKDKKVTGKKQIRGWKTPVLIGLKEIYLLNVWGIVFSLNQILKVSSNLQIAIYI